MKTKQQQVARQAVRVLDEDKVKYDSLVAIYDDYTQQMKDYVDSAGWLLYEANAENKIGGEILLNIAYVLTRGIDLYNEAPTPAILRLLSNYASASPVVKNHKDLSRFMQNVSTQIQVKTGSPFRDFEAVDYATGKQTTLGAVITYPQLIDTDRNNSSLLYGIPAVLRVFLIDRNGIMLGYFRGEELINAVEKALGIK